MKKILTLVLLSGFGAAMVFGGGGNQASQEMPEPVTQRMIMRGNQTMGRQGTVMGSMLGGNFIEHNEPGIVITGVLPDSPAQASGILRGDVVLTFNGVPVNNLADVMETLGSLEAGQTVPVGITRGGQAQTLNLTLETRLNQPLIGVTGVGQRPERIIQELPEDQTMPLSNKRGPARMVGPQRMIHPMYRQ